MLLAHFGPSQAEEQNEISRGTFLGYLQIMRFIQILSPNSLEPR